jgi:RimJ/RimL family protein N-acetyltransferase
MTKSALRLPQRPLLSSDFEFRAWSPADIPSLVTAWSDPEMHRWMPEEEGPFDERRATEFIAEAASHLSGGTMLAMAISDLSNGAVAGSVTFNAWAEHHWNIGYWLSEAYRGQGLATRAVVAATRWAFEDQPKLSRISLYTLPGNLASQRVAERAGFKREGTLRRWAHVHGNDYDWTMFSLLRQDIAP